MKYNGLLLKLFLLFIVLVVLFCVISIYHAYNFTHPRNKFLVFRPRSMDNLSFSELAEVTLFGVSPLKYKAKILPSDLGLKYENVTFKSTDNLSINSLASEISKK